MLKNRFLSVFVLAFAAGIAMPFLLGTGMEAVAFVVSLCIFLPLVGIPLGIFLITKKYKSLLLYLAFAGVGLLLGTGWLWVRSLPYDRYTVYEGREDVAEGTVTESGSSMESSYLEIEIENSRIDLPSGTKIRLYGASTHHIRIGDTVRIKCEYGKVAGESYRANSVSLIANGTISYHASGDSFLYSLRNLMLDSCEDLYAAYDSVGVAQALTVRERSNLPYETGEGYRNAGVAHLLAISGLHLSILVALLRRILLLLRLRKVTREWIALGIILLYCFLTGFSPSIVRASVMLGFVLVGELILDETDGLTVLFFALFVLLMFNPYALLSVGLQLSFLSCLGIMLLEPYIGDLQKRIRGDTKTPHRRLRRLAASLTGSFLISCGAVVFTFPATTVSFGNLSYLAPLSNLIFVPLFTPILALLLLSVLVYPLLPVVGSWLAFLPGFALQGMDGLFGWLSDSNVGSVSIDGAWVAIPVVLSVLAIAAMLLFSKRSIHVFLSCSCCAMASVLCLVFFPADAHSVQLTVSASEGYVYAHDGESSVFVDVGTIPTGRPREIGDALDAYLVTKVDELSFSRLQRLLQDTEVAHLYLPIADEDGQGNDLTAFLALADKYGCTVHEYRYAMEMALLTYRVKEGRLECPDGVSVVLSYGQPSQTEKICILLSINQELSHFRTGTAFYLPDTQGEEQPVSGTVTYFTDTITLTNGEVTQP